MADDPQSGQKLIDEAVQKIGEAKPSPQVAQPPTPASPPPQPPPPPVFPPNESAQPADLNLPPSLLQDGQQELQKAPEPNVLPTAPQRSHPEDTLVDAIIKSKTQKGDEAMEKQRPPESIIVPREEDKNTAVSPVTQSAKSMKQKGHIPGKILLGIISIFFLFAEVLFLHKYVVIDPKYGVFLIQSQAGDNACATVNGVELCRAYRPGCEPNCTGRDVTGWVAVEPGHDVTQTVTRTTEQAREERAAGPAIGTVERTRDQSGNTTIDYSNTVNRGETSLRDTTITNQRTYSPQTDVVRTYDASTGFTNISASQYTPSGGGDTGGGTGGGGACSSGNERADRDCLANTPSGLFSSGGCLGKTLQQCIVWARQNNYTPQYCSGMQEAAGTEHAGEFMSCGGSTTGGCGQFDALDANGVVKGFIIDKTNCAGGGISQESAAHTSQSASGENPSDDNTPSGSCELIRVYDQEGRDISAALKNGTKKLAVGDSVTLATPKGQATKARFRIQGITNFTENDPTKTTSTEYRLTIQIPSTLTQTQGRFEMEVFINGSWK